MQLKTRKIKKVLKMFLKSLPGVYVAFALMVAIGSISVPDDITIRRNDLADKSVNVFGVSESCTLEAKLFGVLPIKDVNVTVVEDKKLMAGGEVFGVKFFTKGVIVVNQTEIETASGHVNPSKTAGLKEGDVIISVDGTQVNTVEDIAHVVEHSYGRELEVCYIRDGED